MTSIWCSVAWGTGRSFTASGLWQACNRRHTLKVGTHYPHVTWAHVMLRVQFGCERRFNFCHCYVTWSHVELWSAQAPARLTHFVMRDQSVECSYRCLWLFYVRRVTTMLRSYSLGTVYAAFGIHQSGSCLCLIRLQAVKLGQAGFGDTSWLTLVWGSWKGRRDYNKEVYLLIQFVTVPDTNNLIGHI